MGQVSAASTILINVEPAATLAAVADYQNGPAQDLVAAVQRIRSAAGRAGGRHGCQMEAAGDEITCPRRAGERRRRRPHRHREGRELLHGDQLDGGPGRPRIQRHREDSWNGAGGIGGFFEKTFAPLGLKKIQAEVLANLKQELES